MITSEWPTHKHPEWASFIVQRLKYLRQAGLEVRVFPFRGNKNPVNYGEAWLCLRRRIDLDHFDLIDAQFGQSGLLALPRTKPLVVTFHGSDLQGWFTPRGRESAHSKLLRALSRFVATRANEIILVARHLARYLPERLSYHVIPCGIDPELFRPMPTEVAREHLGLSLHKRLVLFAADPERRVKRYELAAAAVSRVKQTLPDVELVILNGVPHSSVPLYMNACDALLFTSRHEGSPTVIKEALACNLPIVSVEVADVREQIGNIAGCFVCADDTPDTIAGAMMKVLPNATRIQGRSGAAKLDERVAVGKVLNVYQKALARKQ